MKQVFVLSCLIALLTGSLHTGWAHGEPGHTHVNPNITPYHDAVDAMQGLVTTRFQQEAAWKQFQQQYPGWGARFNRFTGLPHRAFGDPIVFTPGGNDVVAKAKAFLQQAFGTYQLPLNDLVLTRNFNDGKYIHVDFKQVTQGKEVLFSRVTLRFTQDLRIVLAGLDAHRQIPVLFHTLSPAQAIQQAELGISTTITGSEIDPALKIFPYPVDGHYEYRPVYAVTVNTQDDKITPGKYLTYVDANSGEILYRQNKVKHIDFTVKSNVFPTNMDAPMAMLALKNLKVNIGATAYYTDTMGLVTVPGGGPVNATLALEGKYCKIVTGASGTVVATHSASGVTAGSTVDFPHTTPNATERHTTCYYHTDKVHGFMKSKLPSFTAMDDPMTTRVDRTDGNCNAFYNGNSINFYTTNSGCNALSQVNTVVYHEYGHGITNEFWADQGASFDNGAMGEGYSDTWAFSITHSPLIGEGFYVGQPSSTIRRYDINPKVYPQDLVGQVHADGEIIAGCWWDTGQNWDIDSMADLFALTHYGLANGPDGTEGQLYFDILIDALQYDDDNANINDGTPHFNAIVPAFAAHGIYLLSNTSLSHTPPPAISAVSPHTLTATVVSDFPAFVGDVKMIYRVKGTTSNDTLLMTKSGSTYSVQFPASPAGSVYEYIFAIYDNANSLSMFSPANSSFSTGFTQRNIPYYLLVGFSTMWFEPFDNITNTTPGWVVGNAPNDNATAGKWIIDVPVVSITNGDTVQTGKDHTTGTGRCAVTANAPLPTSQPGNADVDGGRTSLITATIDLSAYTKPVVSYWRWYTNSQSTSNPGKDLWRVWASYDNGTTWNIIERTYKPDVSWRRNVLIPDITSGKQLKLMFVATDTTYTGVSGTWVEAAIDDLEILDISPTGTVNVNDFTSLDATVYPNPSNGDLMIQSDHEGPMQVVVMNSLGQVVMQEDKVVLQQGKATLQMGHLPDGLYLLQLRQQNRQTQIKVMLNH